MAEKVKIGVIGLGIMGEQYTRIYSAHPLAEVTAVCNRGRQRLDDVGDRYSVKARYTDYIDLLNDKSVDAVCVATPESCLPRSSFTDFIESAMSLLAQR